MESTITPIIVRRQIVGWNVQVDSESVRVDLADLPAPDWPTVHQINHTARAKLAGLPADKVAYALAIDAEYALALDEWRRAETIRRECVKRTGITATKASRIEDKYQDHSTVFGFDTAAQAIAYELPELGWNPSEDNGAALWEIVSRRPAPRPRRDDPAILSSAAAAVTGRAPIADVVPF
jgi:hypothetical protein